MYRLSGFVIFSLLLVGCFEAEQNPLTQNGPAEQAEGETEGWASDPLGSAVDSSSQTIQNTGDWLNRMYQAASDQGLTTATSLKDWVADDWKAQGDWQYQTRAFPKSDLASMESALNEAGAGRWEAFHVESSDDRWLVFMKRSRRSYLSKVPLKDLVNVLPTLSGEGQ